MSCGDLFLGLIAILFPPIAVWIKRGLCSADSLINILLCVLGYVPGLLHAWYVIAKYPEVDYDYEPIDEERVAYVITYESGPQRNYGTQGRSQQQPKPNTIPPSVAAHSRPAVEPPAVQPPAASDQGPSNQESSVPPPSYSDAVKGDNKVQRN